MNNIAETVIPNKTIENKQISVEPKNIDNNGYLINNKLIVNSKSGNLEINILIKQAYFDYR